MPEPVALSCDVWKSCRLSLPSDQKVNQMTAVAERTTEHNRQSSINSERTVSRRSKGRKAKARRVRYAGWLVLAAVVFCFLVFAYVAYQANYLTQGRRYTELREMRRQTQIELERLNVDLNAEKSPDKVISAASRVGMVYGKEYDYVGRSGRVASSSE